MKRFELRLTAGAVGDLNEIYRYIAEYQSEADADRVFDRIIDTINDLLNFPNRGVCPSELSTTGNENYREVFFKPYRIIYSVEESTVYVHLIGDGRRDFRMLLARRLLR